MRVHRELLERQKLPDEVVGKDIWQWRFQSINALEQHLTRNGTRIVVADSNRFTAAGASASLAVVDVSDALKGRPALFGYLPAGGFPRQMAVEQGGRTLLVTNFDSSQLETVNVADLP